MRLPFAGLFAIGTFLHDIVLCATLIGAEGTPSRGERVFQYCYACHSVQPGEKNLQGPNLAGIIGRPIAAEGDYDRLVGVVKEKTGKTREEIEKRLND